MKKLSTSTILGLAVPLVGIPIWYVVEPLLLPDANQIISGLVYTGVLLVLMTTLTWIVVGWEKRPWADLGIKPQTTRTIIWALIGVLVVTIGGILVSSFLLWFLGEELPTGSLDDLVAMPTGFAVWIVVISSIGEEFLYRGYLIERLTELTGKVWVGGVVSVTWFTMLHYPQGPVYMFAFVLPLATGITAWYGWRRDLLGSIIIHFVFNAPLIVAAILI